VFVFAAVVRSQNVDVPPPIDVPEQACIDSGGIQTTAICCAGGGFYPNTCNVGACGCAPENSEEVVICQCPTGFCYNEVECVPDGSVGAPLSTPVTPPVAPPPVITPPTPVASPPVAAPPTPVVSPVTPPIPSTPDIMDLLDSNPNYSTLTSLIRMAGLEDAVRSEQLTIFAPDNAALSSVPQETLDSLLADMGALTEVLTYHVIPGVYTSSELQTGSYDTLLGPPVDVVVSETGITVNGAAVIEPDGAASNGVVHGISGVLIPPAAAPVPGPPIAGPPSPVNPPGPPGGGGKCTPWSFESGGRRGLSSRLVAPLNRW